MSKKSTKVRSTIQS